MADGSIERGTWPGCSVVVVGARGLLGSALMRRFAGMRDVRLLGLVREACDIGDAASIRAAITPARPDVVINCAAFTHVDACESQEDAAMRVNAVGAGHVAAAARSVGARLIHISTDYVFDGSAAEPIGVDALPGPPGSLSVYGRSKLEGERLVIAEHAGAVIVRTAWMYGRQGTGFPNAILQQAHATGALRVVNDQKGSPTYAEDLADALVRLACIESRGVYHITNAGQCTWYEFACEIVRLSGLPEVSIEPVPTSAFPRPARRPAYSVLDNSRFDEEIGPPLRHWRDAIAECIESSSEG